MVPNEKLIALVSEIKFLYDANDKYYCDNARKEHAWREIGRKLKSSDAECKRSWCLLRDSYRRALKKKRKKKNGEPSKQWKYEEEMTFLLPYIRERKKISHSTLDENITDDEIKEEINDDNDNTVHSYNSSPPVCSEVPISYDDPLTGNADASLNLSNIKKIDDTSPYNMVEYVMGNQNTHLDDIQQFFNSIATTVRSFPLKERVIVKAKVFEIVSQMELDIINRPSTSLK